MGDASTRQAYLDALYRLQNAVGVHPDHLGKLVRVTPTAVAREAGLTRNPLYTTHRDVLQQITASTTSNRHAGVAMSPLSALKDEVSKLRAEVKSLRDDRSRLASENLSLLHRARLAEGRAGRRGS